MNLLTDMMSLRIAPTVGREATAQIVTLAAVIALALYFADNPLVRYGLPVLFAGYAATRIAVAATRGGGEREPRAHDR